MPTPWDTILLYARRYPSPHNTQPIKLRIDGLSAEIFYDLDLGLPAGDAYGIPFGSVAAGILIETISIAAHSLGYSVAERLDFTPMDFTSGDRLHPLGVLTLEPSAEPIDDLAPELLLSRRTSRLRYEQRPVPPAVMDEARRMAGNYDQTLAGTSERRLVDEVIAVNQRTLFYDLEKPAMREEIQGYLRYSERQARTPGDGLSARCLGLPGPLLRVIMGNYWVWKIPVLSAGLKQIYLRSMRGVAHVAWMKGPFANERDYTVAGRAFLRVWLLLSGHGLYLHPFGSVLTNPRSHRELVAAIGEHEGTDMIWMLFRVGYSAQPPESHRRELREMVLG